MSLRKAINDKCRECIYDPIGGEGNWRQQVEACTGRSCPLYQFRPLSKPRKRDRKLASTPVAGQVMWIAKSGELVSLDRDSL